MVIFFSVSCIFWQFFIFTGKFIPMTDDKTALLEKENTRLNRIIEALLFEHERLRRGYSVSGNRNAPE
jgi:hypothetical protein